MNRGTSKGSETSADEYSIFNEANLNLPGIFLFGHYSESCFEKGRQKSIFKNISRRSEFSSSRVFQRWSRNCRSPSGLLAN